MKYIFIISLFPIFCFSDPRKAIDQIEAALALYENQLSVFEDPEKSDVYIVHSHFEYYLYASAKGRCDAVKYCLHLLKKEMPDYFSDSR